MEETAVPLPDDVLLEILVRVYDVPATLFRCATVCKRWHSLVTDPSFLRRCWPPESASSSFQGFFIRELRELFFVPAPRSVLRCSQRPLSYLIPSAPAGLFNCALLLASGHGLLLVSLHWYHGEGVLAVCNPLAGTCDLLPPLKWENDCIIGYAILTGVDCGLGGPQQPLSYYKVLVVDSKWDVYMLSSHEATWSRTSNKCFGGAHIYAYNGDAVVQRGKALWLCYDCDVSCLCTINVNIETGHVSMMKHLANPRLSDYRYTHSRPCLSLAVDGNRTLSVLQMQAEHPHVEIWQQQGNEDSIDHEEEKDTSTWHCTRVIELRQPGMEIQAKKLYIVGEKCGTLLVSDGHQRVYFTHLETGIMEDVICYSWDHLSQRHVMAFEIDWLAIFISRLGSR